MTAIAIRSAGTAICTIPDHLRRTVAAALLLLLAAISAGPLAAFDLTDALAKVDPGLAHAAATAPASTLSVIVRETHPASPQAERLVREIGGTVTHELPIVGGFSARVPAGSLAAVAQSDSVGWVWGDGRIRMKSAGTSEYDSWPANTAWRKSIQLPKVETSYNGAGVTVAFIDTGTSKVTDLGNRVLARVDFTPDHDGVDTYGHGTHMAGVVAGSGAASSGKWKGVAPAANLVSIKVAGADGSTDVSVVIAALQWVVTHRDQYGIRILNLAFGTDGRQSYSIDPLNYAVEQVWFSGVLVVVSAGNRGSNSGSINKPGDDPFVVTVGAADLKGTADRSDDVVAPFSSRGPTQDGIVKPDLVAPGITVVSSRVVGSTIDVLHPAARVGTHYFKGTGTSQAAAVVSGVAALMFQADPALTPDVAKAILMGTAYKNPSYREGGGRGLVDAAAAVNGARRGAYGGAPANQGIIPSDGSGSLEAARGSYHVLADLDGRGQPDLVSGEIDVLGNAWSATSWSGLSWSATTWCSLVSESPAWSATSWSGLTWSGTTWSATTWSATSWSATTWS